LAKLSCAARNETSHWDEIFNIREIRGAERNTLLFDANCRTRLQIAPTL